MVKTYFSPVLYAAFGTAFSYYGLAGAGGNGARFVLVVTVILFALIAIFRALEGRPAGGAGNGGAVPGDSVRGDALRGGMVPVLAAALGAGFFLGAALRQQVPAAPGFGMPRDRVIALTGTLTEDPRLLSGGKQGMGMLAVEAVRGKGGLEVRPGEGGRKTAPLPVFFPADRGAALKEYGRGGRIYVEGSLVEGRQGPLFRASSVFILRRASPLERFRTGLRLALLEKLSVPGWGPLAQALLLGAKDDLDRELSGSFRQAGCSHVLALSGMHLAILSGVIAFFLKKPLGKKAAALAGALFAVFFIYLAGAQASLVRSGIMYLLGCAAMFSSLKTNTKILLALAFIIQLVFQSDAGLSLSFIFSYLALAGLLWFGEDIADLLRGRLPQILGAGLAASLGAFLATAWASALFFGELRPVGILAGLIVAPLSALFMLLALAFLGLSWIPFMGLVLSHALALLYKALELLVSVAGKVPGVMTSNPFPVLALTLAAGAAVIIARRRLEAARRGIGPFADISWGK